MYPQRNNRLVWDESMKIMQGLFIDLWENQDVVTVDHVVDITLPVFITVLLRRLPSFLTRGFIDCTFCYWSCRYAHTPSLLFQFWKITRTSLGFGRSVSWKEDGTIIPP